jgi:allantoinase
LNSQVCEVFPQAVEEMKKRGWEFIGHGATNSNTLAGLPPEQERDTIRAVLKTIEQATGKRPRGWLSLGLVETPTRWTFSPKKACSTPVTGTMTTSPMR